MQGLNYGYVDADDGQVELQPKHKNILQLDRYTHYIVGSLSHSTLCEIKISLSDDGKRKKLRLPLSTSRNSLLFSLCIFLFQMRYHSQYHVFDYPDSRLVPFREGIEGFRDVSG